MTAQSWAGVGDGPRCAGKLDGPGEWAGGTVEEGCEAIFSSDTLCALLEGFIAPLVLSLSLFLWEQEGDQLYLWPAVGTPLGCPDEGDHGPPSGLLQVQYKELEEMAGVPLNAWHEVGTARDGIRATGCGIASSAGTTAVEDRRGAGSPEY